MAFSSLLRATKNANHASFSSEPWAREESPGSHQPGNCRGFRVEFIGASDERAAQPYLFGVQFRTDLRRRSQKNGMVKLPISNDTSGSHALN